MEDTGHKLKLLAVMILFGAFLTSCCSAVRSDLYNDKVTSFINEAISSTSQEEQQKAFDSIINLGCDAVPAIAASLGDSRRLPINYLRLTNDWPYAFEAFRQYGPETVTDALAAILNQLTGRDFGFIYNGAADAEREKAIKGWHSFLAKPCSKMWCRDHPTNSNH
jgi:hypothetical protein